MIEAVQSIKYQDRYNASVHLLLDNNCQLTYNYNSKLLIQLKNLSNYITLMFGTQVLAIFYDHANYL